MYSEIKEIEERFKKNELPDFRSGDTVAVHLIFKEGDRERTQIFEGVVLKKRGRGIRGTFTVRKISFGIGVERTFPLHSPLVKKIDVIKKGKVRRANLTYLRAKIRK